MTPQDDEPFAPEEPPQGAASSPTAKAEEEAFGRPQPQPNTFFLPLGSRGHISWHSESSTAVLGVIVLVILAILTLFVCCVAAFAPDKELWFSPLMQALGSALAAVAGAIVGATATTNPQEAVIQCLEVQKVSAVWPT